MHVTGAQPLARRQQVAFAAQPTPLIPDSFRSDIYVVPAAGGAPTPLVARKGPDDEPAWSPDGKWIAFVSQDGRDEEWYTNSYVCVVPAAGGTPRTLTTSLDEPIGGLGGSALTWTPDSTAVLFPVAGARPATSTGRRSTGRSSALTSGPEVNGAPFDRRKGETLVFLREDSVTPREVWALPLATARGRTGARSGRAAAAAPKRAHRHEPAGRATSSRSPRSS